MAQAPSVKLNYTSSEVISSTATLYYRADEASGTMFIGVVAKTKGWVGVGITRSSGMLDADLVLAWVTTAGQGVISDRTSVGMTNQVEPKADASQDWKLLSSSESGEYTVVEMSRAFDTCDAKDVPIAGGTTKVLVALCSTEPATASGTASNHDIGMWAKALTFRAAGATNASPCVTPSATAKSSDVPLFGFKTALLLAVAAIAALAMA